MNIYSYDMRGNFIGLSSPVIDLTIASDTSGFFTSGNATGQQVKRELAKEEEGAEETEGEGVVEKEMVVRKKKESRVVTRLQRRSEGTKESQKKNKRRKSYSVIPSALRKTKKSAIRSVDNGDTSQEEEASGVSEQEATLSRKKTVVEDKSTKGLASKVARKGQRSAPRDGDTSQEEEASGVSEQEATLSRKKTVAEDKSTKGLASKVARKGQRSAPRDGDTSQEEEASGVSEQEATLSHKEKTVAEDKSTKGLASKVARKGQRSAPRYGDTSEEEEASGVSEQEATLSRKEKTVAEDKSTKGLASKVARKWQRSAPRDGRGESGSDCSDTTTQNGKSSDQEPVASGRRQRKKGDTAGNKKVLNSVGGSDSIMTGKGAAEKGSELATDCLVDTLETAQENVGNVRKVKVQHKKAKRGVSISDRVVVIGEGGGGERGESPKEWTKSEVQKLSR